MPKAFWKGVISFGMVVIPVKMYTATAPKTISFHLLHKKCLTRPKQVLHCDRDSEYFSIKDTVRGYEYAKDRYVVLTQDDFKKVKIKTAHSINIIGFVDSSEVDSIYYHSSHYLEPEQLGIKPFALLSEVLTKTKKLGIAKVAFQTREHLCALRPLDGLLLLQTLYYKDEIVRVSEPPLSKPALTKAELEIAGSLVSTMSITFKPDQYKDDYKQALKKMVDAKLKGVEIKEIEEPKIETADLMTALKESLSKARKLSKAKEAVAA